MQLNGKNPADVLKELKTREPAEPSQAIQYWQDTTIQLLQILQQTANNAKLNPSNIQFKLDQANNYVNIRIELLKEWIAAGNECEGAGVVKFEAAFKLAIKPMEEFIKNNSPSQSQAKIINPKPTLIK